MNQKLRAVVVSVDFADLLERTLPYNVEHFDQVWVVTTSEDKQTQEVAWKYGASVYTTNAFYEAGASFNKSKALEEAFAHMGRWGWVCLLDVDILWSRQLVIPTLDPDCLYGPSARRVLADPFAPIPDNWNDLPLSFPNCRIFGGYTQIFHASAACLGPPPWFETNWRHAGGYDTMFQNKWPRSKKVRLPFEVLHLGEVGINWCGRLLPYQNGVEPKQSEERLKALASMVKCPGIPRRGPHERILTND